MADTRKRTAQNPLLHGVLIAITAVIGLGVGWVLLHSGGAL
ncbi:hypothetical protein BH09PSE2_BH09PSE2_23570 [soil metagenome]